jgi:arogenate dehydrogenase (NADP+)
MRCFQETIQKLASSLQEASQSGLVPLPLIVDVLLSVKEHPRNIMLTCLPQDVDFLCSHPIFGSDSAQHGWNGLNLAYERTKINGIVWDRAIKTWWWQRAIHS